MLTGILNQLLIMSVAASALYIMLKLTETIIPQGFTGTGRYYANLWGYSFFFVPYTAIAAILSSPFAAATSQQIGAPFVGTFFALITTLAPSAMVIGGLSFAAVALVSGYRLERRIVAACRETQNVQTLAVLDQCKRKLGITREVRVYTAPYGGTPFIYGVFKPRIVLPERTFSCQQLEHIFLHELTHLKRGDLWLRILTLLVNALHWFNPLTYVARRRIDRLCELACDASVTNPMSLEERQAYCALMLDLLRHSAGSKHSLLSQIALSNNARYIAERIGAVMEKKNVGSPRRAFVAQVALGLVLIISGALVAHAAQANLVFFSNPTSAFVWDIASGQNRGGFQATADAEQLATLNRLRNTEISFGELIAAVFPQALPHMPEEALKFLRTAPVNWPADDAHPKPRTYTIGRPE